MCGINLLLDKRKKLNTDDHIRQMSEATRHRGPDHEAWTTLEGPASRLFMANNRLRILDLSEQGNQPMQCGDKGSTGNRFTLTYNGELYNHYELKNELLQKGYSFRSTTDTEVLLYSLVEWGKAALPKLQGMFAFAFYDQAEELLLMARDPHGMKPLYYFGNANYLIASSEIRGILASKLVARELNASQIGYYLQFRYAQKPQTFYQNIYELLPGTWMEQRAGMTAPEIKEFPASGSDAQEMEEEWNHSSLLATVEEKLTDALFSHLQTDRTVGMFLSGGIDSTLMLALLRNNGSYHIPDCFTIVNSKKEAAWGTKDYIWAAKAAQKYNARHFPLEIDASILHNFDYFIAGQDQPIGDSAAWLTSVLSKEAIKKGVPVILSGAGADELFGGYNRHIAFHTYLLHHKKLKPLLPFLKPVGSALPAGRFSKFRKPLRLWKKIFKELDASPSQTFLNFLSFNILPTPLFQELEQEPGDFKEGWMMAALQHDRKNYLVSDILALNDKASMQHGLEMRMPYLSPGLSGIVCRLPASLLMQHGPKWILSDILRKNGGEAFVKRKKEGFGLPFGLWVKEGKTEFLWEWLQDKENPVWQYMKQDTVQQLLHQHKKGQEDFSQELFSLAVLGNWLAKEFI